VIGEEELKSVVAELETVATWHTGARRNKVAALIRRLRGEQQTPTTSVEDSPGGLVPPMTPASAPEPPQE